MNIGILVYKTKVTVLKETANSTEILDITTYESEPRFRSGFLERLNTINHSITNVKNVFLVFAIDIAEEYKEFFRKTISTIFIQSKFMEVDKINLYLASKQIMSIKKQPFVLVNGKSISVYLLEFMKAKRVFHKLFDEVEIIKHEDQKIRNMEVSHYKNVLMRIYIEETLDRFIRSKKIHYLQNLLVNNKEQGVVCFVEDSVFCKSFISKLEKYLGMCMILIILDDQSLVNGLREIFNNIDLYKKSNAF